MKMDEATVCKIMLPFGGGLDEAFETYYKESEQLPTRLKTLVKLDEKGECVFAGVVVLQPLPFADETVLERTENAPLEEILRAGVAAGTATVMTVDQVSFTKETYNDVLSMLKVTRI